MGRSASQNYAQHQIKQSQSMPVKISDPTTTNQGHLSECHLGESSCCQASAQDLWRAGIFLSCPHLRLHACACTHLEHARTHAFQPLRAQISVHMHSNGGTNRQTNTHSRACHAPEESKNVGPHLTIELECLAKQ